MALISAAENGHTATVKALLDHGANPNAQNNQQKTALLVAIEKGHAEVAELLKNKGATE
jgi:ankyrin repeat protein